jgi:hypothetical protein
MLAASNNVRETTSMPAATTRILLGFTAGALSVLVFHQSVVELLHLAGIIATRAWSMQPVRPLGIPRIVDLCFWGGLYGAAFGALLPRFRWPVWTCGLLLGCAAVLVGWFVVAPIKGAPIAAGFVPIAMGRSLLINVTWGLGVGLILPLLLPQPVLKVGRAAG